MDTKICRLCGKLSRHTSDIFKTDGLRYKIETCLPIVVSPNNLLPDTICSQCLDNVESFFMFIKNCLQNIIILEQQYDIHESCLKTKRKKDKGCTANMLPLTEDKSLQIDYMDVLKVTTNAEEEWLPKTIEDVLFNNKKLVDYEESSDEEPNAGNIELYVEKLLNKKKTMYFDDAENHIINEINQLKSRKRKLVDSIETQPMKIFKMDSTPNRRKNKQPKKVPQSSDMNGTLELPQMSQMTTTSDLLTQQDSISSLLLLPQICLLCESQFPGAAALAAHVFDVHGIDMAEVCQSDEKRKKLPNLVKISDLKRDDNQQQQEMTLCEDPPTLLPSFVCPTCPAVFTARGELFVHLRLKHPENASLMCGVCLAQTSTPQKLKEHIEQCPKGAIVNLHQCSVCLYSDANLKLVENHILVHDFLLQQCTKQGVMFDPADYVLPSTDGTNNKSWTCADCTLTFDHFKLFSAHMRSQHSRFYCDLCNKYYGRNSHLWKHVNRLHKGHPSITCQICHKTSASKYHLQQHFNKIHSQKPVKKNEDFMAQKFQAFDFQSVKQSFMRQELLEADNSNTRLSMDQEDDEDDQEDDEQTQREAPKEIDSSSNLYTNIITNYTPPVNIGDYKCPKCGKGFQKKPLLKKHKKNCRPRLQKDLLTRCKSCARIFKDRQSLTKHLDNYHSEYVCEICQQKVQSKCEIVSHIRFQHPDCHLICKICGNILRSLDDLSKHMANHNDSFICQFCADPIPSKIKLKMHILSLHRKILSLSCGICLKLFETQHILRDHVKLVHKDKLHPLTSCPVCGKNYGSKWKTFDHLNKSHGRIFKACRTCLEVFDTVSQLDVHMEQAHSAKQTSTNNRKQKEPEPEPPIEEPNESDEEESINQTSDDEDDDTNKMSLLEKRLMIKKPDQEDDSIKKAKISKQEDNPPNSSKRTVYVNSNDPSYCEICFKDWPAKKHLWQHYIRCHKTVAATVCGICLKTNDNYKTLQQHLLDNHPNLLHGQGFGSNFICRICGRYHNASSKLKLHMAIHENFDWSILSEVKQEEEENGYDEDFMPKEEIKLESINYDDDIEQVECSSQSDDGDDDEEEEDDDDDDDNDNEEESDKDNKEDSTSIEDEDEDKDSCSYQSDNNEDTKQEIKSESDSNSSFNNHNFDTLEENDGNAFRCKPEELDSAIKSISYNCVEELQDDIIDDYCDMQQPSLNETELESAVGSIL